MLFYVIDNLFPLRAPLESQYEKLATVESGSKEMMTLRNAS